MRSLDSREVVGVEFTAGADSDGEPSIFFGIVLTPQASQEDRLADVTSRVTNVLLERLEPYHRWGLLPYFNFTDNPAFVSKLV